MKKMRNDVNTAIKFRIFHEDGWEGRKVRKVEPDM
jgi:hypothetical protein